MTPCLLQHQGCMYQLNSRILKSYCKCSYSLPAAKPAVYPQMCSTVAATQSSSALSSISLLSGFVVTQSLSSPRSCLPVLMSSSSIAEPVTCPHFCAPVPWFGFRPVPRLFSSGLHYPSSLFPQFLLPPPLPDPM